MLLNNVEECRAAIIRSMDKIVTECKCVLGSELHYQAMIYHALRTVGNVPIDQLGMNVKTGIKNPQTKFLKDKVLKKNKQFRKYGIEIIPDITIYDVRINADWRRINYKNTLRETLYSLEVKASERHKSRIEYREIREDLEKLMAQREETRIKHNKAIGTGIIVVDVAPVKSEGMKESAVRELLETARSNDVGFWYFN